MKRDSGETGAEQGVGHGRDVISNAVALLAELDNTPLSQMTPLFYQHGFEESRMVTKDLLRILGHDLEA
ncbi:MAG: hypothetical protein JWQ75_14 [Pseudarthrobacter sp.]|nr:hypothetical protein [Pseudarthrobacter sp.]